jgi:hypothetical protein
VALRRKVLRLIWLGRLNHAARLSEAPRGTQLCVRKSVAINSSEKLFADTSIRRTENVPYRFGFVAGFTRKHPLSGFTKDAIFDYFRR